MCIQDFIITSTAIEKIDRMIKMADYYRRTAILHMTWDKKGQFKVIRLWGLYMYLFHEYYIVLKLQGALVIYTSHV